MSRAGPASTCTMGRPNGRRSLPMHGLPLTQRFIEALAYATEVHAGQSRKGTSVPYVSHVLAVCSLVLEDRGGEDEAIAALLHDAVEDGGGQPRLEDIRRRFGDRVAEIVWTCSDTDETPKPPWKDRKTRYIAHVRAAGPDARRVSCADKLHNARSILRDYRALGERLWDRFKRERGGQPLVLPGTRRGLPAAGPQPARRGARARGRRARGREEAACGARVDRPRRLDGRRPTSAIDRGFFRRGSSGRRPAAVVTGTAGPRRRRYVQRLRVMGPQQEDSCPLTVRSAPSLCSRPWR